LEDLKLARYWHDLTWTEFAAIDPATIAILPVGATEQHGPHLTVSVDTTLNEGVLGRTLELLPSRLKVLVLPTQAIGVSVEHDKFPGSLYLRPETAIAAWSEIAACVARAGVRKLVLFNSHGGQPQVVDIVVRRARIDHRMFAVGAMWSRITDKSDLGIDPLERKYGIHAGQVETAMMQHLAPSRVRPDQIRNFPSAALAWENRFRFLTPEGGTGFGWQAQDLNEAGAVGDASKATPELGRRIVDAAADAFAQLLGEIDQIDVDVWIKDGPRA